MLAGERIVGYFRFPVFLVFVWGLVLSTVHAARTPAEEAAATVVVYNSSDPLSRDLAEFYGKRRGIPDGNIVGLKAPTSEEISRQEFNETIARPLRERFEKNGWWTTVRGRDGKPDVIASKISYMALIRGIPLKVRVDPTHEAEQLPLPANILGRNEASVDSELAVLANYGRILSGFIPNPYFKERASMMDWRKAPGLLLVTRLDGTSGGDVRRMIEDSIAVEKTGLWGWAYVDSRGLSSGNYLEGDTWLREAAENMLSKGIPVIFENLPQTLPKAFPVTEAAVYLGWYAANINGPFAADRFRFQPGAITAHIHSFSAATLRNPVSGWTAPLILHGAAASVGNVYEPYLSLTVHLNIFQDRLMDGYNLAESAYMATPGLSWMGIVVGDPLYRPYGAWKKSDGGKPNRWRQFRSAVLEADGNVLNAASSLRNLARSTGDPLFLEALGNAQSLAKNYAAAVDSFSAAENLAKSNDVRFRLTLERMLMLHLSDQKDAVEAVSMSALAKFPDPAQSSLLLTWTRPPPPPPQPVASPGVPKPAPARRPSGESLRPKPPQPPGAGTAFP